MAFAVKAIWVTDECVQEIASFARGTIHEPRGIALPPVVTVICDSVGSIAARASLLVRI